MAIVPEPERIYKRRISFQLASRTRLAAKVSLIGASPEQYDIHDGFKPEPEVSIVNNTLSFKIATSTNI